VQVYCVGLRAGSNALKNALLQLGYRRAYSMGRVAQYYSHLRAWRRHATGEKPIDFARFFSSWDVAKAHPAMLYPEEVIEAFPDVKVVLLQRDPEAWFRSYQRMVRLITALGRWWFVPRLRIFHRLIADTTFAALGPGGEEDQGAFLAAHEGLYARVDALLPAEQVLRFDVRDGWEPLCAFLDRPVPDVPFPRTNRRQSAIKGAIRRGLTRDIGWLGAAAAALVLFGPSWPAAALIAGEVALFGLLFAARRA
jgi:hypothetical protein